MEIGYTSIILSILMALLPAIIWLEFLNRRQEKDPKLIFWIFIYGIFSVIPILSVQYLWYKETNTDLYDQITSSVGFLLSVVAFGGIEEIVKFLVLVYVDFKKIKIKNINDAVKYIIIAALGFAFIENILYFREFIISDKINQIFYNFTFRAIFTTCAHLVFSGIVGYHYALGRFSKSIYEQEKWQGESFPILNWLHKIFHLPVSKLFAASKIIEGLIIAVILHASYNYFLQRDLLDAALLLVIIGAIIVYYLMKMKAGYLIFMAKKGKKSMMASKDEEVVIELLGLWLQEGRYKEVEEICERLLQRDPDSNIVRLFKARAHDKLKLQTAVSALKALFSEKDYKEEKSLFEELKNKTSNSNSENIISKISEVPKNKPSIPSKKTVKKPKLTGDN